MFEVLMAVGTCTVVFGALLYWMQQQQRRMLANLQEQLNQNGVDRFQSLAAQALESNNRQFLDLAKTVLERESSASKFELEKRQTSIEQMLKPLEQSLQRYESQTRDLERERHKMFVGIEAEFRRMVEANNQLHQATSALKDALKKPHIRGRWGEVQLRNCVELAGMSEYCDVVFQDVTSNSEGDRAIPDMTVRMPGGRVIVVDCKTPLDAFIASLEATTDELRTSEMLRHGRHVKEHVKRLSTRAYYETLKDSPDFTVMFLPNESFLYAALEAEPDVVEFALQRKVLIATPPTLVGLMKVIRFGWNEEKLTQNAFKISEAGQELHKRLVDFVEAFTAIGKSLEKAKAEYDSGLSRLERRVLVQARRMEALGVKSNKSLPEGLGVIEEMETSI